MYAFCNKDCGDCPLTDERYAEANTILCNSLIEKYGESMWEDLNFLANELCNNIGVCHYCGVDDFCHSEQCAGHINWNSLLPKSKSRTKTNKVIP